MTSISKKMPLRGSKLADESGYLNKIWYDWFNSFSQTAVTGVTGSGYVSYDGSNNYFTRTFTAGSTKVSITYGDGSAGNTVIDVNQANLSIATTQLTGTILAANFPALTGDVTTTQGTLATTLANTSVTAGSYTINSVTFLTVDAKGRITSITSPTLAKADLGLGSVENTALSTWAGSTNLTTMGIIATGTWHGSVITQTYTTAQVVSVSGAGLATGTVTNSGNITVTAATKTDENTGTSTTTASTPANHYNNPAGIKCWATVSNNGSSATLQDSLNISSVSRTGAGVINVTLNFSMANTTYGVVIQTGSNSFGFNKYSVTAANTITITTANTAASATDVSFNFIIFGHTTN